MTANTDRLSVYSLTPFQLHHMTNLATGTCAAVNVLEASPTDNPQEKQAHNEELRQMRELVDLSLLIDASAMFKENIVKSANEKGRAFRVYALTEAGLKMFCPCSSCNKVN